MNQTSADNAVTYCRPKVLATYDASAILSEARTSSVVPTGTVTFTID